MDDDYYLLWRVKRGVAEGSIEIPKGIIFSLFGCIFIESLSSIVQHIFVFELVETSQ